MTIEAKIVIFFALKKGKRFWINIFTMSIYHNPNFIKTKNIRIEGSDFFQIPPQVSPAILSYWVNHSN